MTAEIRSKTVSDSFEDACVECGTHDAANSVADRAKFGPMRALTNVLTFLVFTALIAIAMFGLIVPVHWGQK